MSKTTVDITPDKSLIQKLGLTGYRTEQAISELIDNSIDARIHGKIERIDVILDFTRKTISVADNGIGMNLEDLKNGLTIAKGTKFEKEKLGRFGLGMKSACSTMGKAFTIVTTRENSDTEFVMSYDEDEWLKDNVKTWKNFEIETRRKVRPWHGTTLMISKLKVPLYPNQVSNFRKGFGIRYGEYVKTNQVSLFVNTRECKPIEPLLEKNTKKEIRIELSNNNYISGWIGLLEKRSIKGDYGIHLYKNARLIKAFDKFGIRHHPEVAKIVGELHLDHVPVNFHKTGFIEDSLEYKEALEAFKTYPTVIEVLRSTISKISPIPSIETVLNYFVNDNQKGTINTRLSNTKSKILLEKAKTFRLEKESNQFEFVFEDGKDDELYRINRPTAKFYRIFINRKSPVFEIVGNPLFLIGLIEVEIKSMLNGLHEYEKFLKDRNAGWNAFVRNWSPIKEEKKKRDYLEKKTDLIPRPGYSLVGELIDLHDYLQEKFDYNFQFTALSTLAPFLSDVYNKMVYTIHTTKGSGQLLNDMIADFVKGEFLVLLEPKTSEIKISLEVSEKKKFIVIREYVSKLHTTWATPEKAWLDLFFEVKRNDVPITSKDLDDIFDVLIEQNLIDEDKLMGLARHRNAYNELQAHFGNVE